jgi:hypothetical protein
LELRGEEVTDIVDRRVGEKTAAEDAAGDIGHRELHWMCITFSRDNLGRAISGEKEKVSGNLRWKVCGNGGIWMNIEVDGESP